MKTSGLILLVLFATAPFFGADLHFERTKVRRAVDSSERELVEHFKFTNRGNNTVTVAKLMANCGCMSLAASAQSFSPGETGDIAVTMNVAGAVGEKRQLVLLITVEDGKPTEYQLQLDATIEASIEMTPRILYWNAGEKGARHVQIKLRPGERIGRVDLTGLDTKIFTYEVSIRDDHKADVALTYVGGGSSSAQTLSVIVTRKDGTKITLPLFAKVMPPNLRSGARP